jgi:1,4-alpha-glucan branching enzyme
MIRFGLSAPNAGSVCVAGTFNGWKPGATPLTEVVRGHWFKYLRLNPGRYEYHFLVDGKRVDDTTARAYVPNPDGGRNAVLLVQ